MKPVKLKQGDVVLVSFETTIGADYNGNCLCTGHLDVIDSDYLETVRREGGTVAVVQRAGK